MYKAWKIREKISGIPKIVRVYMNGKNLKEIENILAQEIAIILTVDPSKVIKDVPLHEMGIDSLSFVELLVFIEKKFNIKLMESGLTSENFRTIRSLASSIRGSGVVKVNRMKGNHET